MILGSGLSPDLLSRIEDAGINASAPREQRWIDGWLVRFSPGKAKRARCIQAVAAGRLSVAGKLRCCLPVYAEAGLRLYVRVTPFSEPAGLDEELERAGMERIDDTRVMVLASLQDGPVAGGAAHRVERSDPAVFVDWIGAMRGSSEPERRAHLDRIVGSPVPHRAALLRDGEGAVVAGGQVVVEGEVAGLYDVFTAEGERGRGHARAVCRHLLAEGRRVGARVAYLQVDAGNQAARRAYAALGFVDAYTYHYRSPPEGSEAAAV